MEKVANLLREAMELLRQASAEAHDEPHGEWIASDILSTVYDLEATIEDCESYV